jgi:hypothetical protein
MVEFINWWLHILYFMNGRLDNFINLLITLDWIFIEYFYWIDELNFYRNDVDNFYQFLSNFWLINFINFIEILLNFEVQKMSKNRYPKKWPKTPMCTFLQFSLLSAHRVFFPKRWTNVFLVFFQYPRTPSFWDFRPENGVFWRDSIWATPHYIYRIE